MNNPQKYRPARVTDCRCIQSPCPVCHDSKEIVSDWCFTCQFQLDEPIKIGDRWTDCSKDAKLSAVSSANGKKICELYVRNK